MRGLGSHGRGGFAHGIQGPPLEEEIGNAEVLGHGDSDKRGSVSVMH